MQIDDGAMRGACTTTRCFVPRCSFLSQPPDNFNLMEAQAWTAIAVLAATLVGSLFYLGNRIDFLGARLHSRIDGLSGRIDGLTARVEDQGRQLGSQIYELGAKLDDHLRRHAG